MGGYVLLICGGFDGGGEECEPSGRNHGASFRPPRFVTVLIAPLIAAELAAEMNHRHTSASPKIGAHLSQISVRQLTDPCSYGPARPKAPLKRDTVSSIPDERAERRGKEIGRWEGAVAGGQGAIGEDAKVKVVGSGGGLSLCGIKVSICRAAVCPCCYRHVQCSLSGRGRASLLLSPLLLLPSSPFPPSSREATRLAARRPS